MIEIFGVDEHTSYRTSKTKQSAFNLVAKVKKMIREFLRKVLNTDHPHILRHSEVTSEEEREQFDVRQREIDARLGNLKHKSELIRRENRRD